MRAFFVCFSFSSAADGLFAGKPAPTGISYALKIQCGSGLV
ncbi:hypothetical protein PMI34_05542, partial [Pseudomonas sp. GM74]